ncbi:MAG: uridine kinase [Longimicrobiales bacterium]|nr:uridine kinase [Longimicrobiales bacterium]
MVQRSIVVGIAGGSASGKSTVVRELVRLLLPNETSVLSHDAYYHDLSYMPLEQRIEVNVDHPDSLETLLLNEHVGSLLAGRSIEVPSYDYVSQTRSQPGVHITPAPVVIIEGLLVLGDPALRALMDLAVFVDASEAVRLQRRIARDVLERGRSESEVVEQHHARVQPMHDEFVEPSRRSADLVVPEGGHNQAAVEALAGQVRALLHGA